MNLLKDSGMQRKKATLKDVAAVTGLSVNTVSRALHDKHDINADTRRRVREVAARLNYSPNPIARKMSLKRKFRIGVVLPKIGDDMSGRLFNVLDRGLAEQGYTAMALSCRDIACIESDLEPVIADRMDGMVVMAEGITHDFCRAIVDLLLKQAVPFVVHGRSDMEGCDCVTTDMEAAVFMAAGHFVGMGKCDLACLYPPDPDPALVTSVLRGMEAALKKGGLPVSCRQIVLREATSIGSYQGINELLKSEEMPAAIFCCTDEIALGAMRAVEEYRLSIPEDVAICGFGNSPEGIFYKPSLMTFDLRIEDMTAGIISLLMAGIDDPGKQVQSLSVTPALVIRETGGSSRR
ncbi:MAG: LacI family DNA-binding transcriptional regulator [bacterium]|nr:LacI family DNA-binding transcriptional regulator [bacterium]